MRSIVRVVTLGVVAVVITSCGTPIPRPSPAVERPALSATHRRASPGVMASPLPSASASNDACAVTTPNGSTPPGEATSTQNHGDDGIWTVLWPDGTVVIPLENVDADGVLWMKFPWWRARSVKGRLEISGQEVSTGSIVVSDVPDGYGQTGFQASGIGFPRPGCYSITARAADARLTFVTRVRLTGT